MFVDHVRVFAKAGKGGRGCVSFRREKFVPKGGPNGGDGGRGGSVVFLVDNNVDNLTDFYYTPHLKAKNGEHGQGKNCYGRAAADAVFRVPVGTLIWRLNERTPEAPVFPGYDQDNVMFIDMEKLEDLPEEAPVTRSKKGPVDTAELELIADLQEPGQSFILCQGGQGGKGNVHFKSSRNRVPTQYTDGDPGEEGMFYLELRKIADAGLVGYPNAGKSTLLTRISNAHPKIAPYPFTTLTPHIGVVEMPGYIRYTVADIPGIVEGAHENVGLGHDFLRHIVRCKLLIFVLDMAGSEGREPIEDLQKLRRELDLYDPKLSERPWIIVANKMDLPEAEEKLEQFRARYQKIEVFPISAGESAGLEPLKSRLAQLIAELPSPESFMPVEEEVEHVEPSFPEPAAEDLAD